MWLLPTSALEESNRLFFVVFLRTNSAFAIFEYTLIVLVTYLLTYLL